MSDDIRANAYDKIDRYLRNNLDDTAYAEFSAALECVWRCPSEFEQWVDRVDAEVSRTAPEPEVATPSEILASRLIDAWCAAHGNQISWAKAVEITAIVTKMPDAERARLLSL